MRHRAPAGLMLLAALAVPGLARAAGSSSAVKTVNVEQMLGAARIASVRGSDDGIPILLPTTLRLVGARASSSAVLQGGYRMELDYREPCDGANVCTAAEFTAERGSTKPYGRAVALADGIRGGYSGIQCGASCSPAAIQWREHGVLYSISGTFAVELTPHPAAAAVTRAFVAAADQAIDAGPR